MIIQTIEMPLTFTSRKIRLAVNMQGCKRVYGMHDCELDEMLNFHHDGNVGIFNSIKPIRYCNNSATYRA